MGYTTEFSGEFGLNKPLSPFMLDYLKKFSNTRHMRRKMSDNYGIEGEFFVEQETPDFLKPHEQANTILDGNHPASTQPGLWCQWIPNEDGTAIEWDGGEKFYEYTAWIIYLIEKILKPNGYVLNGVVAYRGEDWDDQGEIVITDNQVQLDGKNLIPDMTLRTDVVFKEKTEEELTEGKVAKLVTFSFMTRVIVDENATEEEIVAKAKGKILDKVNNELHENLEEIQDDLECPIDISDVDFTKA